MSSWPRWRSQKALWRMPWRRSSVASLQMGRELLTDPRTVIAREAAPQHGFGALQDARAELGQELGFEVSIEAPRRRARVGYDRGGKALCLACDALLCELGILPG